MNGLSLSAQEVARYRTIPEVNPPEPGATRHARAVELARERHCASGAKSELRAAAPRARA